MTLFKWTLDYYLRIKQAFTREIYWFVQLYERHCCSLDQDEPTFKRGVKVLFARLAVKQKRRKKKPFLERNHKNPQCDTETLPHRGYPEFAKNGNEFVFTDK